MLTTIAGPLSFTFTSDPTLDYYMLGDGSPEDALDLLYDCIVQYLGLSGVTVTLDSNSHVRIGFGGFSGFEILWNDSGTTLDGTVFGFTANATGGTPFTSDDVPMGLCWLDHVHDRPVSTDTRARQPIVGGIQKSISGRTRASRFSLPSKERNLSAHRLHAEVALEEYSDADRPYSSLESMHVRSLSLGRSARYYPDDANLGTYDVVRYAPPLRDRLEGPFVDQGIVWRWAADFVIDSSVGGSGPGSGGSGGGGGGGSGAPIDAEYVVVSLDSTLTDERRLQVGPGLTLTDGGANDDITISITDTGSLTPGGLARGFGWWHPGSGSAPINYGLHRNTLSGTITHPNLSNATFREALRRWRNDTGTSAGTDFAAERGFVGTGQEGRCFWRGDSANMGGFFFSMLGLTLTLDAGSACFCGLWGASGSASPGVATSEPSTFQDNFGLGADTTDTNLQIITTNAGGNSKIDLGIAKTSFSSRVYDAFFYAAPNDTQISYLLRRRDTSASDLAGDLDSGTYNLPADTAFMGPLLHAQYPGSNVAAVNYEIHALFGEWNVGLGIETYGLFP